MTEKEILILAQEKIRAEHATYMRKWRKQNPDKEKASRERCKQNRLRRICEEVERSGQCSNR